MRLLTQPRVLARALVAALLTTLACYPRLAMWPERPYDLPFTILMMLWCVLVFWAFVFAWHQEYSGRPVFNFKFEPNLWVVATLAGVAWALFLHVCMDPQLRRTTPGDYPTDWYSWVAITLFSLALEPLFLCFAPFAFFIRLSRRQTTALALVVLFWVFILYLKLDWYKVPPPFSLVVELMIIRVLGAFLSVYFYLRGGVLLVWWMVLLSQLRHVIALIQGG